MQRLHCPGGDILDVHPHVEIILADELTGNLDTKTKAEIMNFLLQLQKEKKMTVTVITHEPEIAEYAETVIHIVDGKIVQGG